MTESEIRSLVRVWQRRLGLDGWRIVVKFDSEVTCDGRACLATVHRSSHYERAVLTVDSHMLEPERMKPSIERDILESPDVDSEAFSEETIVHELLHCVVRDLMEAGDLVRHDVHPAALETWDNAWRRAEEATVDRLARTLVASFRNVDRPVSGGLSMQVSVQDHRPS